MIVVPKIGDNWTYVAYLLEYNIREVKNIEEKFSDPTRCCIKLFEDWLTKNGTPKSWHTLLKCIRYVEELVPAIDPTKSIELIEEELKVKHSRRAAS